MMTLGSLFDGSGGFPLAGTLHGIKPLWASEIEPYPIRVTKARFPEMKHLGSVLDVKGGEIDPVDIITFGSPCQDLSVAGKQKGIHEGERSSLFFEAVRIAKEMREHDRATGRADVDLRPRFLVWENVPGAFSSNQGEDFRAVLEALGGIAEDGLSIPRPAKGKWNHAGCVVGDGWSIAWRMYDAQYWGVPQRRKRIYLIADLTSERAGEILFEREGLRGDSAESGEAWQGIAGDAQGGAGGSCLAFKERAGKPGGGKGILINKDDHAFTLSTLIDQSICVASFKGGQGPKAGSIGYQEGTGGSGGVVFPLNEQIILRHKKLGRGTGFGAGENGDPAFTLQANHPHMIAAFMGGQGAKTGSIAYSEGHAPTLKSVPCPGITPRRYIVRRLTPLECCRLQGFPDWWEDGVDGSDSARYKMWGNGIALPCAVDVLGRVAKELKTAQI